MQQYLHHNLLVLNSSKKNNNGDSHLAAIQGVYMARPYARLSAGTLVLLLAHLCTSALAQDSTVIAGQNINMVAGTERPLEYQRVHKP